MQLVAMNKTMFITFLINDFLDTCGICVKKRTKNLHFFMQLVAMASLKKLDASKILMV